MLGCYLLLGTRTATADYTVAAVCALGLSAATLLLAFGPPLRALLFGSAALPKVRAVCCVLCAVAVAAVLLSSFFFSFLFYSLATHSSTRFIHFSLPRYLLWRFSTSFTL